jgi:hypothetical protein
MNQKIREHLTNYCIKNGWETTDKDLLEVLTESREVFSEITGSHRWYDDKFVVVEVDGMLIGYDDFYTTGDNDASDMGLEYDIDSVCEVEKKQKMVDYYEPIKN